MTRRKIIEVTQCRECAAIPAYCDEDGCCSACGNDIQADIAPLLKVKLVEHSPAADAVIRAVISFCDPDGTVGLPAVREAVARLQKSRRKRP